MKPTSITANSASQRVHWAFALIALILISSYGSLSLAADDQTPKAVRRSSSEAGASAKDQKRVALVVGNGDYKTDALRNPAHDAEDISGVLKTLGFAVHTKTNVNQREIEEAVKEFVQQIQNGDVALFYFSGHGVQVAGENYLIPVGCSIETEADARYKAVNAGLILAKMDESRNRTNIFILDACRNNPFKGFKSLSKGLNTMDAPAGTFIAYATAPGSVAADGSGRNSPYAKHLIEALRVQSIPIEQVFKQVLREVRKETGGKQVPWTASSLPDDFYFNPPSSTSSLVKPSGGGKREDDQEVAKLREAQGAAILERARLEEEKQEREQELAKLRQAQRLAALEKERLEKEKQELLARVSPQTSVLPSQGEALAENALGDNYCFGKGVTKDYEQAVEHYKNAAEQGNALAQTNLGYMYQNGFGVAKDYSEAAKWHRKAADQGNDWGQNNLGGMYEYGFGVPKDYAEAVKWYRKAADQGNAKAQNNLGYMCQNGFGVGKNYKEAVKWYKKAAENGNSAAQYSLGLMYKNGAGIAKNQAEARKWFQKAADQGDEDAKKALAAVPEASRADLNQALLLAAQNGPIAEVKRCLSLGADVNAKNADGLCPLHFAARSGHLDIIKLLLDKGAPVDSPNNMGASPLVSAIAGGQVKALKLLLDRGADANLRVSGEFTPLMLSVIAGNRQIVEALLKAGADIGSKLPSGETALSLAESEGKKEIAQFLKSKTASAGQ